MLGAPIAKMASLKMSKGCEPLVPCEVKIRLVLEKNPVGFYHGLCASVWSMYSSFACICSTVLEQIQASVLVHSYFCFAIGLLFVRFVRFSCFFSQPLATFLVFSEAPC